MTRMDRIRALINERFDNPWDLLALRLEFPPLTEPVDLADEIQDLYIYPERLHTSYREEWQRLAARGVYSQAFVDHWRSDEDNLARFSRHLSEHVIPRRIHRHRSLFQTLGEVLAIERSRNTVRFPDPRREALMRLIWPEGGEPE